MQEEIKRPDNDNFRKAASPAAAVSGAAFPAESGFGSGYTLDRLVILSRHNIRSPLAGNGSVLSEITPHRWFEWTSGPGELSRRGAALETAMGRYFRFWLEREGLFTKDHLPEDGAMRFYANAYQRTQASAKCFCAGLLPGSEVPVERHAAYGTEDGTFLPLVRFLNEAYAKDALEEVYARGGGEGLSGYRRSLDDALRLLVDVTDMNRSGACGNILEDATAMALMPGRRPFLTGAIKNAVTIADALVMQYYEEPDERKAAFGHDLTIADWRKIGSIPAAILTILFSAPLLSVNLAHPMLKELYSEMTVPGRRLGFLCGHDSTITCVLGALGAEDYELPHAIEPTTPIGVKLVFERRINKTGDAFWKARLVYQGVAQLRSPQALPPDDPPEAVPILFRGITPDDNGMIAEADLLRLFEAKIQAFEELPERYPD